MSNTLSLKLTLSGHSTEQQRREIESELSNLFNEHGIRPPDSVSCREGSTEIIIQYILDNVANGFLTAIGGGIFALICATIHKKRNTKKLDRTENSHELIDFSIEEKAMKTFIEKTLAKQLNAPLPLFDLSKIEEYEEVVSRSPDLRIDWSITEKSDGETRSMGFFYEIKGNNKTPEFDTFENPINK